MQLEKATAHSGEAGLAGWISSNDVTLFTMVLVVVIALFLQSNLLKGEKQNAALTNRNREIQRDLANTSDSLGIARHELDETRKKRDSLDAELMAKRESLRLTQEQRNKLDADLLAATNRIANLDRMISDLTSQKTKLETEKGQLTKQGADLGKEKAALNERLNALAGQLAEKIQALRDVELQRERLKEQANKLDGIVATLEQKLAATNTNLDALRKQSDDEKTKSAARIQQLEGQAKTELARAEDYLAKLQRAAEAFKGLRSEKQALEVQLSDTKDSLEQRLALESRVNRELLGLRGNLKRVAFLFDASGSMKEQGTTGEDRWAQAQSIAAIWLQHLEVDECVLIVFSTDVHTFPSDGTMLRVRGPQGEANRNQLLKHLKSVRPEGWTNTLDALRSAYKYPNIDAIILFSDGAPTRGNSGKFDPRLAEEIYGLCRQHANIPINSVGLGNYFDPDMGTFLRSVARHTSGTFRGR